MKLSKKAAVLLTSYALAGVIIMGGFIYSNHLRAESYKLKLVNTYQHAFAELVTGVGEIDTALQKCVLCTTPSMRAAVCTEVFGKAMSAQMALGELPFMSNELEQTAGFISRVGDYAYSLARSAAAGVKITDEQAQSLASLSGTATTLSGNLTQLLADIGSGSVTLYELEAAGEQAGAGAGQSFKQMESEFPEIPSLIYDGPFSHHISLMTPKLTENAAEITAEEAIAAAAAFTGLERSIFEAYGERGGSAPVYLISARVDGGELALEITKNGGIVLNLLNSRLVESSAMSVEDGVGLASDFLENAGYESMTQSYWTLENNTVTVNFAYEQDGVICYPDLVKVTVALDTGSVVGFESLGYVMSHTQRDIPEAAVTEEAARELVCGELTILSHSLAVIPTSGKNEVFCHEFKCESADGRHYIAYVNAVTGAEEKLLILLESENGTLAI